MARKRAVKVEKEQASKPQPAVSNKVPRMLPHQEKFRICGYRPPLYFWYFLSGLLCDTVQFFVDWFISLIYVLDWERVTVCWTVSYILTIAVRHTSHKHIVFGDYEGTYWGSLCKLYGLYATSIVLSAVSNKLLVYYFFLPHTYAYFSTMLWTGILNYFLIKNNWNNKQSPAGGIAMRDMEESAGLLG